VTCTGVKIIVYNQWHEPQSKLLPLFRSKKSWNEVQAFSSAEANAKVDSKSAVWQFRELKVIVSQKVTEYVIARREATKQSNNFKWLCNMRLLRFARNDGPLDFLRVHQK